MYDNRTTARRIFGRPPFVVFTQPEDIGEVGVMYSYRADQWALLQVFIGMFMIYIGWWPGMTAAIKAAEQEDGNV